MKTIVKYHHAIVCIAVCFLACSNRQLKYDKDITLVIDQSDPLRVKPDADEIILQSGLKQDAWQGVRVNITYVSDKDINTVTTIALENENKLTGNTQLRDAQVAHFTQQLRTALSGTPAAAPLGHSIIYRTLARQLNTLSASTAVHKYMLVYSDLMENDELSFYDPATLALVHADPGAIRRQFEKSTALHNLSGIHVWLLYDPATFEENNTYMAIATLYKQILESKSAVVYIGKTPDVQ